MSTPVPTTRPRAFRPSTLRPVIIRLRDPKRPGTLSRALRSTLKGLKWGALALAAAHWLLLVVVVSTTILWTFTRPPATPLMAWRMAVEHHKLRPIRYVPLRQIPRTVRTMLVRLEDWTFWEHHGIDLAAIRNAVRVNKIIGRPLYGGSTITQQLARSLYLTTHKNYARKYVEAIIAVTLEVFLTKERILELYFNYVEWGPGVYGIGAAARYHFGKDLPQLGVDEYRRLLTLLSSPVRYTVWSFGSSRLLAERYAYLVGAFPTL